MLLFYVYVFIVSTCMYMCVFSFQYTYWLTLDQCTDYRKIDRYGLSIPFAMQHFILSVFSLLIHEYDLHHSQVIYFRKLSKETRGTMDTIAL